MDTTVTSSTQTPDWSALEGSAGEALEESAAGANSFIGVLGDVAGGVPGAVGGILLSPASAGGETQQGQVEGQPGLTFGYHPDDPIPEGSAIPPHMGAPPPAVDQANVETFPATQPAGATHTGTPAPQVTAGNTESFPASQKNGPTVLEARAQPPVTELPAPAGSPEGTRSYQVGGNTITLIPQPGGTYKADVTIREDFGDVVRSSATKQASADARADGADGDVGFHTTAHRFFPGLTETIVPGNGALNNSNYRAMENKIAAAVADGYTVAGTIAPLPADQTRPDRFSVELMARDSAGKAAYEIGGIFPNEAP